MRRIISFGKLPRSFGVRSSNVTLTDMTLLVTNVTTAHILSVIGTSWLTLFGGNDEGGYLLYNNTNLQMRNTSELLQSKNLKDICRGFGFTYITVQYPFFELEDVPNITLAYRVDGCSVDCKVLYLQCGQGYVRDDSGDVRLLFRGIRSAVCFEYAATSAAAASQMCKVLGMPDKAASLTGGNIGSYNHSWKLTWDSSLEVNKRIRYIIENGCAGGQGHFYRVSCPGFDVGLTGKNYHQAAANLGVVIVRNQEGTGSVCMETPSPNIAKVACRSLRMPTQNAQLLPTSYFYPAPKNSVFNGVSCRGDEDFLANCSATSTTQSSCNLANILAVACGDDAGPDYSLKLVYEPYSVDDQNVGRLEVLLHGIWGTVCRAGFTNSSAVAACRKLGKPTENVQLIDYVISGSGVMWLSDVKCPAGASGFQNCPKNVSVTSCTNHILDVILSCGKSQPNGATLPGVSSYASLIVSMVVGLWVWTPTV